ncbi:MAG: hypothetical protein ACKO4K_05505 [Flavobacteriales bacterium]
MRYFSLLFILLFGSWGHGQGLPGSWIGFYQGTMECYGKESTPFASVPVRLTILEVKKDSVWTYFMTYGEKDKPGYLEKKYYIVLKSEGLALDEGEGVIIPMRLFGNCLIDFYSIEDNDNSTSYMSSVLCLQANGDLAFTLYGGSMVPLTTTQVIEEADATVFGLKTYPVGFNQQVILKRFDE